MRWTLRIAVALGALFLALAAVFLVSLVAVPVLPRTIGLSEPVRRALRPHLPKPPAAHAARLLGYLVQRERHRLFQQLARDARVAHVNAATTGVPSGMPKWNWMTHSFSMPAEPLKKARRPPSNS